MIADHQGAGGGSVEFGDDPRMYEFLVESSGIDWSISVQETFAATPVISIVAKCRANVRNTPIPDYNYRPLKRS